VGEIPGPAIITNANGRIEAKITVIDLNER
jgi:hypothetical protein